MLEFHISLDSIIQVAGAITAIAGAIYAVQQVRGLKKDVHPRLDTLEQKIGETKKEDVH